MNKLDRFRFGSYHKRRLIGLLIIIAGMFLVAFILLALLGIFGYRSELVTIRLSSNSSNYNSDGIGINLNEIPTSNRIEYSNFERESNYQTFMVADCSESYVYFDLTSGINDDLIAAGSEIKILSLDNDGVMSLRYSGLVNDFDSVRFGPNIAIEDSNGYWVNDPVTDIASCSGTLVALTNSGKLILDITSSDFVKVFETEANEGFVDVLSFNDQIFALSTSGNIYSSTDGRNFSLFYDNSDSNKEIRCIAGVGSNVVFLTADNHYYIASGTTSAEAEVPFLVDENTIILSSTDKLLVVSSDGTAYSTSNGVIFERVEDEIGLFYADVEYLDYTSVNNSFYFLTSEGELISLYLDSINESSSLDLSSINPTTIDVVDGGNIIIVTEDKKACLISREGSISDLSESAGTVDAVFCDVGDRILMRSGNNLSFVTLLSAIQVNSVIPSDSVNLGDLCYIRNTEANAFSSDSWFISSLNTSVSYYNTFESEVTNSSLRVLGQGEGVHAVSQGLYGDATDNISYNTFYRISLKLRTDSEELSDVKVWISGEEFGEVGFVVEELTSNSKEYSYVFALTGGNNQIVEGDKLYFNIAFEGDGIIFIDDVYFGEDKYSYNDIPNAFSDEIVRSNPSTIRLNNLNFASANNSDEILYGMGTESLEGSLNLVKNSNASPWFVIGSYIDFEDVENFMGYMCGSVSNGYGKLRIDHGTAIPWSRQFDTIYIEITDSDGAYLTDMQRGAYVSYVKALFAQSSFYNDIKDRVVFLDGMTYEGGVVQSSSDYHAMTATIDIGAMDIVKSQYENINYQVPRMPRVAVDVGEYISVLSFNGTYDVSREGLLAGTIITSNASFVRMFSIDIPVSDRPIDTESEAIFDSTLTHDLLRMISHLSYYEGANGLYYDVVDPLDSSSAQSASEFCNDCAVSLVENDGTVYLTVSNLTSEQQQFRIEGEIADASHILRFSSDGTTITDRAYRRSDLRFTLQPGEVIVISFDRADK